MDVGPITGDLFGRLSDDLILHVLSTIYTGGLCQSGTICAALVRLVAKRWKKIIALRMPARSRVTMTVSESWYLGNQPSIELIGVHPFRCRAAEVICKRVKRDDQTVVATVVSGPPMAMEHRGYPILLGGSAQPTYIAALTLVAFDTGHRVVHVNAYTATVFKCERDRPTDDDLLNLQTMVNGLYPRGTPAISSKTCLASRIDAQMSEGSVMSFMDQRSRSGDTALGRTTFGTIRKGI